MCAAELQAYRACGWPRPHGVSICVHVHVCAFVYFYVYAKFTYFFISSGPGSNEASKHQGNLPKTNLK